jgi:threonine dehydratase
MRIEVTMMRLHTEQIDAATNLLRQHFAPTRLLEAPSLTRLTGARVYLKLESELPTGSFKVRGAVYALSARAERGEVKEVVASSTGNHGAAVAYAAKLLHIPATIFLPRDPNPVKRAKIAELGARIVEQGRDISAAFDAALAHSEREGAYFLNDATDEDVPAGTATIACEIFEQAPQAEEIYVPMGDTALIRGIGSAVKHLRPHVRILGVQAEGAPSYYRSWMERKVVTTETCMTIADGLATRIPDAANVREILELVDEVRLVSEREMLGAIRHLLQEENVVAEPAGAATTAALLAKPASGARQVVLIVSGTNISEVVLRRAGQGSLEA